MKFITRSISALAFAVSVLTATAAFATTPFDIATRAYRGQIEGIPGYLQLVQSISTRKITGEDILEAAGLEPDAETARDVEAFLRENISD